MQIKTPVHILDELQQCPAHGWPLDIVDKSVYTGPSDGAVDILLAAQATGNDRR